MKPKKPTYICNAISTLEMDFFVRSADCLVPIEVKAENNRAKSLRTLIGSDRYPDIRWGVKLVNGNVGYENGVLTLSQWCAFRLPEIIRAKEGLITPDERKALGR